MEAGVGMHTRTVDSSRAEERFRFGDRVRHLGRPEWGIGNVTRAEVFREAGIECQRVTIRFPNGGLKVLVTSHAPLERIPADGGAPPSDSEGPTLGHWAGIAEGDWLAPVARKKIDEAMITLPQKVRDPFLTLAQRIAATLELYRFGRTGGSLIDWAVAQTGLDDPLTRFNRHELERYFDRWALELDAHLGRLVHEARERQEPIDALLRSAPPGAQRALRRPGARR